MQKKYILWFKDVDKNDVPIVGGKGANLGEMYKAGLPVPNGFIVTAQAYRDFIEESGLKETLTNLLEGLDVNDSKKLEAVAAKIRHAIVHTSFPKELAQEIIHAYFQLDRGMLRHATVAVRSSATAEDLPGASFAGQQDTYLNIRGEANLLENVRKCWASLFTARAIFYRASNHFDHMKVTIAVPVQRMVESDMSGVMFTLDPVTNDKHKVIIEAIYGLGEMIVQGMVTPDHYEVDKETENIIKKIVNVQEKKLVRKGNENVSVKLDEKEGGKPKLTDELIIKLAQLGKKLENHYYFPQDSEWAIEDNHVYLVQTRPVTTTMQKVAAPEAGATSPREMLLKGDPASPGIASGPVKILQSAAEIDKIKNGDILVAQQTNPDYVPAMRRAAAIITERGGRTSHAAIVSRELGIPACVGTKNAMTELKDGMVVTVNGTTGEVSKGAITRAEVAKYAPVSQKPAKELKTATKVYVNLAEPDRVGVVSDRHVDGVGLLRAEFMIAGIGTHPKKLLQDHQRHLFVNDLSEKLEVFCAAFDPRPVIYRATDFKTNEYRNLKGGEAFEPEEPNPMLGFRGAARYVADPAVFEMELDAIKQVRNKKGLKNLHLMIPFVRSPKELLEVKKIIAASGLSRSPSFKLFLMVEIPTNVIRLDDFIDVGIDGISIGSNDLTMLILGTDRDNSEVAGAFSEMDPAVLWALEHAVKTAVKRGVTASICGQAPSDYPELVEKLVEWGITSISVNPDAIDHVRETVYQAEKKLVSRKRG